MKCYRDLDEAWHGVLQECHAHGDWLRIDRGSYQKCSILRKQIPCVMGCICNPLPVIAPDVPSGIPRPVTIESIDNYFKQELLGCEKAVNEEYSYGERIMIQLHQVIDILQKRPYTNQAVIEVAKPEDLQLKNPPCLRTISFMPTLNGLSMGFTFRSWDLWAGFPTNTGGLIKLLDYVAGFLESPLNRALHVYFTGYNSHYYSFVENCVKAKLKVADK